jgi:L-ascorbate metabolism protein UlaG (beta-lactamase superfamily)
MNGLLRGLALLPLLPLLATPTLARAAEPTLTWHGQSCFVLTTPGGARVLMDPIPGTIGYPLPSPITVDVVTISHEHPDHTNTSLAAAHPRVLRGLTEGAKGWAKIDEKIKDVRIRNVGVWHDEKQGAERGLNSVFVFEFGGMTVAHLGDLGHLLTPEQLAAIGKVDLLLVPTGGVYTLDEPTAWKVIEQLKPRQVVVPMHYKTEALKIPLHTIDAFLKGHSNVRRPGTNTMTLTKPAHGPEIVVLSWK